MCYSRVNNLIMEVAILEVHCYQTLKYRHLNIYAKKLTTYVLENQRSPRGFKDQPLYVN